MQTPAAKRFVSVEPCLAYIDLTKYIGYNPMYENIEQRAASLQSGQDGAFRDIAGRDNLEIGRDAGEPLESAANLAESCAAASRARSGAISASSQNDRSKKSSLPCPSAGVDTFQRYDPNGDGHQPQEWEEKRQQPRESRGGLSFRESETRLSDRIKKSGGGEKSESQANERANRSNQNNLCGGSQGASRACENLRGIISGDFEDCQGRPSKESEWNGCRLYKKATTSQHKAQSKGPISLCIVGGESGPGARPMHPDWARSLRDQCKAAAVPFFFKGMGGVRKQAAADGHLLDGKEHREFPEDGW